MHYPPLLLPRSWCCSASVIGAGIFVLPGQAAAMHAGPAIMLSFVIAGSACTLADLCYAEFAAMMPVSGSRFRGIFPPVGHQRSQPAAFLRDLALAHHDLQHVAVLRDRALSESIHVVIHERTKSLQPRSPQFRST